MEKESLTIRQVNEMLGWLARLSLKEYQDRRSALRKVTDPRAVLDGAWWSHPFITPLEKGFHLITEGPECTEQIVIADLDFIAGAVLSVEQAGRWETMTRLFSQHHAEQLLGRWEELPRFVNGTAVVFPGTVYGQKTSPGIEFHPCLYFNGGMPVMGMIARHTMFDSSSLFPYLLHTKR